MRTFAVAALGAGVLLLAACTWDGKNTASDDNAVEQSFSSVRIGNDSGSVKIHNGSKATVHRTIHYDKNRPGSTYHVDGNTLVVESCRERNCSIDYELTVPAGTRVDGKVDSGDIEVDGVAAVNLKIESGSANIQHVSGKVNVDSSSGRVQVSDVADAVVVRSESGRVTLADLKAAVTAQADSGSIEAHGVGGAADLKSQSGSVTVGLASPQNVRVQADSGNVTLSVPRAEYRVTTETGSGQVHNGIGDQPSGTYHLDLHTASGDVTLNYV
jgi:DUF4097 and DUF4098 domain-containing protein YvlB